MICKKYLFALFLLLSLEGLMAQQTGIYSQFGSNAFTYNPGFVGLEKGPVLNVAHRTQWAGFKDAPSQQIVQFGSRLITKKIDTAYQKSLPISNNSLYKKKFTLETKRRLTKHNIGGFAHLDTYGPFSRIIGSIQYAYRWRLKKGLHLNTGFALGTSYLTLNANRLSVLEPGDQVFDEYQQTNLANIYPDAGFGLVLFSKNFYLGYGANQILINQPFRQELVLSDFQLMAHHMLSFGYVLKPSKAVEVVPTLNALVIKSAPISTDIGLKMRFNRNYWFSLNLRPINAIGFRVGGLVAQKMAVNYSYELSTNRLHPYHFGTHEIGISFFFKSGIRAVHLW